jgi:hypothetical protein
MVGRTDPGNGALELAQFDHEIAHGLRELVMPADRSP